MGILTGYKNTKTQGNVGIGIAIGWMVTKGWVVSIPLTDNQDYDLIIDIDSSLKKVQVKTTGYKTKYGIYNANLSVKGGNRSSKGSIKYFDNKKVDYVFIVVDSGEKYFIPSEKVKSKSCISLGKDYSEYKVLN